MWAVQPRGEQEAYVGSTAEWGTGCLCGQYSLVGKVTLMWAVQPRGEQEAYVGSTAEWGT